eukprot:1158269-Pelagomonas_calceolata.AAC.21
MYNRHQQLLGKLTGRVNNKQHSFFRLQRVETNPQSNSTSFDGGLRWCAYSTASVGRVIASLVGQENIRHMTQPHCLVSASSLHTHTHTHLCQLGQGQAHLLRVALGSGLNGDLDHRLRELHALQDDGLVKVAQSVTCGQAQQEGMGGRKSCTEELSPANRRAAGENGLVRSINQGATLVQAYRRNGLALNFAKGVTGGQTWQELVRLGVSAHPVSGQEADH